ncbi:MAG: gluconate permease [Planctomycetes bacterium]|nr:gluconate permease [Planctomycetota bacterium]
MIDPLLILAIGIVTVIGMIIVLRVNAFVALVTAAIVVSLLAPGATGDKISRVAEAFGGAAAKIGIVIAMAAVIGKCLMDSGAADRIVRSFLNRLGEKRAATALMGSGFVLAVPVFFDTVFYLLVPLARSLWRRTHKNYMLYILAIGCGGAITHSLVPPTPGPLVMAVTLDIDLGWMIMIGTLVALPTALVGLLVCRVMNRWMDMPMRPYTAETESEPLDDDQLPSLWISLLPVLLPVVLISANTVTNTIAGLEHAELVRQGDVLDWSRFSATLGGASKAGAPRSAKPVLQLLPMAVQDSLAEAADSEDYPAELQQQVQKATTELVASPGLYHTPALGGVELSKSTQKLLKRGKARLSQQEKDADPIALEQAALGKLSPEELVEFNWLLLESAFPAQVKQTPRRSAAQVTALLGDPNLALLLSAAIAMLVLVRQRGLSLRALGKTTEGALMSGGIIILITAGGGAFGAMLKTAQVGDSVEQLVGGGQQSAGMIMLVTGFAVAAVLKVAQGSGTVSMITASAMMAAMIASPETLGYHPVYLATAIGSGSMVGSWMNDSGFWIFARMSVLTETEALKSWTILLVILGFVGLGVTMALAWAMPLV